MKVTWNLCTIDKRKGDDAYATRRSPTLVTLPQIQHIHRNLHLSADWQSPVLGAIVGAPGEPALSKEKEEVLNESWAALTAWAVSRSSRRMIGLSILLYR